MNKGKFEDDNYYKYVDFSKAVLWKDKQLSLPPFIIAGFNAYDTKKAIFTDLKKKEKWIFNTDDILTHGKWKKVGQEKQLYFPIWLAKKKSI